MAKIVLDTVTGGYDLSVINNNFDKIETELQNKVLYRDNPPGEPNTLVTDVDVNAKRLYNLPEPLLDSEAARLQDVQNAIAGGAANLIEFTPYGNIAATNVQAAIQEGIDDLASTAAGKGAALVGFDGGTLTDFMKSKNAKVVDSIAALKALDKTKFTRACTYGYYAAGDGGGAEYWMDAADTASADNGVTVHVGADGARWKLKHDGTVNIRQGGAKLDGVSNDTLAWQNTAATGLRIFWPEGGSLVRDKIVLSVGQVLQGAGRTKSYFVIDATFNMAATSVLQLGTGEPGAHAFDIGFRFAQANQAVRANVTAYPPAIDGSSIPRFVIDRIRIEAAYDGIKATGNAGGAYIGFIEVGALNKGLQIDGALDFVHGGHWHFWPFGIVSLANLMTVYQDGNTRGPVFGALDGCNIDSISTFACRSEVLATASTSLPIHIGKLQCDADHSSLTVAGGNVSVGQMYASKTVASAAPSIDVSAGQCVISSLFLSTTAASSDVHTSGTGKLFVNGGRFEYANASYGPARADGGLLSLDGVLFTPAAINFTQAAAVQASGALRVNSCKWTAAGANTGIAVLYVSDNVENHCSDNDFGGWQYAPPAAMDFGRYSGNNNTVSTDVISNFVVGNHKTKRLLVTSDGSGNYSGAHGIANAAFKVLSAVAYYKGASGEMAKASVDAIDNNNVYVSGAGVSKRVRIAIDYTEAQDVW